MTWQEWALIGAFLFSIIFVGFGFWVFFPEDPPAGAHRAGAPPLEHPLNIQTPLPLDPEEQSWIWPLGKSEPHRSRHAWRTVGEGTQYLIARDLEIDPDDPQEGRPIHPR